jgi:hypothetical protein
MRYAHAQAALLSVFISCALTYARGQESKPSDLATPQARAHAIREAVIEAYGTPEIVSAYHVLQHAVEEPAANPPQPGKKKNGKSERAVLESQIYSQMDESGLFVNSFSRAMYMGLERPPGASTKTIAPARSVARSLLFRLFDYVVSSIPFVDVAGEVAEQRAARTVADAAA